jgi:hypothetical protein
MPLFNQQRSNKKPTQYKENINTGSSTLQNGPVKNVVRVKGQDREDRNATQSVERRPVA